MDFACVIALNFEHKKNIHCKIHIKNVLILKFTTAILRFSFKNITPRSYCKHLKDFVHVIIPQFEHKKNFDQSAHFKKILI